jgi:hypothetical protein
MVVLLSFCGVGMAVRSILTVSLVFDAFAMVRDALMRLVRFKEPVYEAMEFGARRQTTWFESEG